MIVSLHTIPAGRITDRSRPIAESEAWPRIYRLCYGVYFSDGLPKKTHDHVIKPSSPGDWIKQRMDEDFAERVGEPLGDALASFAAVMESCSVLVGFDLNLHRSVLGAEVIRAGMEPKKTECAKVCLRITSGKMMGRQAATIEELHSALFGAGKIGHGRGMDYANAAAKCYFEMRMRGHV